MIDFAENIDNPLLRLVLCFGEGTIQAACDITQPLLIQMEMTQFIDGRDAVHVRIEGISVVAEFTMLFSNYFDARTLFRITRRAWLNRAGRSRMTMPMIGDPAMN